MKLYYNIYNPDTAIAPALGDFDTVTSTSCPRVRVKPWPNLQGSVEMASHYLQSFFLAEMSLFWAKSTKSESIAKTTLTSFYVLQPEIGAYSDEYGGCE